jgi:hypothetical protein
MLPIHNSGSKWDNESFVQQIPVLNESDGTFVGDFKEF